MKGNFNPQGRLKSQAHYQVKEKYTTSNSINLNSIVITIHHRRQYLPPTSADEWDECADIPKEYEAESDDDTDKDREMNK